RLESRRLRSRLTRDRGSCGSKGGSADQRHTRGNRWPGRSATSVRHHGRVGKKPRSWSPTRGRRLVLIRAALRPLPPKLSSEILRQTCSLPGAPSISRPRRSSARRIPVLLAAKQIPHPLALPSSPCCAPLDIFRTQRNAVSAAPALSLFRLPVHIRPPGCR